MTELPGYPAGWPFGEFAPWRRRPFPPPHALLASLIRCLADITFGQRAGLLHEAEIDRGELLGFEDLLDRHTYPVSRAFSHSGRPRLRAKAAMDS
jgi:hypothetical protein